MTDLVATTPGLFPPGAGIGRRPRDGSGPGAADATEDLTATDATASTRRATLVELQTEAGLDRVVEGQAGWTDLLAHPLSVHDVVERREPARHLDTDATYREPAVVGPLDFDGRVAAELAAAAALTDDLQAVLPGPYTLADLATDEHYGDDAAFLAAVAAFLAGEVAAFPPVETLFLLEPALVASPPGEGPDERASEAVDVVARAADADVVVHTYGGAMTERVHAYLLDAAVDAVGYDLVADHAACLALVNEFGTRSDVALGLVDGRRDRVELAATVRERVAWFHDNTPVNDFETTYVTASSDLLALSPAAVAGKLSALADAASDDGPSPAR